MNVKSTLRTSSKGVAGAMALAAGTSAYANIVSISTPSDFTVAPGTVSVGPVTWDVNGDGISDFQFVYRYNNTTGATSGVIWQAQMNPFTGTGATNGVLGYTGPFVRYAEAFSLGTTFGATPPANTPAVSFSTATQVVLGSRYNSAGVPSYYGGFATAPTTPGTQAFVGFRFNIGANTHYGWLRMSVGPGSIDFISAAWDNTPGAAISAGAVPEPTTLALLSLGAVGVLGVVRRRRSA